MQHFNSYTAWIAMSVLLALIALHKIVSREQPIGFSVFLLFNVAHLAATFFGHEKLAFALQVPAVTILLILNFLDFRHEWTNRKTISGEK